VSPEAKAAIARASGLAAGCLRVVKDTPANATAAEVAVDFTMMAHRHDDEASGDECALDATGRLAVLKSPCGQVIRFAVIVGEVPCSALD
jgi:hypothetical protein